MPEPTDDQLAADRQGYPQNNFPVSTAIMLTLIIAVVFFAYLFSH